MSIYEYRCDACESVFEVIQKFSDDPLEACEKCDAPKPHKMVSTSAFHLKGSGWYATDYGGKNGETPAASTPKTESKPVTSESD
jgi:putative FmdB family regulatory protein